MIRTSLLQILTAVGVLAYCANAVCPNSSWKTNQGICYNVFRVTRAWHDGLKECQNYGGTLASIHNDDQNDFFEGYLMEHYGSSEAWIGLNDRSNEGSYKWADGSKYDFAKWARGEPNDRFGEDCVQFKKDGYWNDEECNDHHDYICEIPY